VKPAGAAVNWISMSANKILNLFDEYSRMVVVGVVVTSTVCTAVCVCTTVVDTCVVAKMV
jgi:hypothetical protein